jgi:E3 ubiquitin-protein ligase RNF216
MAIHNHLYAPTFIYLHNLPPTYYVPLKTARSARSDIAMQLQTPEGHQISLEVAWIASWLERRAMKEELERKKKQEEADAEAAKLLNFQEHEANGGLLEWYLPCEAALIVSGCCFDDCPANVMTCCSDGHIFCLDCAKKNAETTVGNGGFIFRCMDVSGCKAEFTTAEVVRFVDAKTIALRDKLQSGDAVREVCLRSRCH